MAKRVKPQPAIDQQISDFEAQHPKIAEALRVFDISIEHYQEALTALNTPRIYQSTTTTGARKGSPHGKLGSSQPGDQRTRTT